MVGIEEAKINDLVPQAWGEMQKCCEYFSRMALVLIRGSVMQEPRGQCEQPHSQAQGPVNYGISMFHAAGGLEKGRSRVQKSK